MTFGRNDAFVIAARNEGPLKIWSTTYSKLQRVLRGHRLNVYALAMNRASTLLASGAGKYQQSGGELKLWDLATGVERFAANDLADGVCSVVCCPDGSRLATGHLAEQAGVWDVATSKRIMKLNHERMATVVVFSPDGRRLATGSYGGTIAIWAATSGERLLRLKAFQSPSTASTLSPTDCT